MPGTNELEDQSHLFNYSEHLFVHECYPDLSRFVNEDRFMSENETKRNVVG